MTYPYFDEDENGLLNFGMFEQTPNGTAAFQAQQFEPGLLGYDDTERAKSIGDKTKDAAQSMAQSSESANNAAERASENLMQQQMNLLTQTANQAAQKKSGGLGDLLKLYTAFV